MHNSPRPVPTEGRFAIVTIRRARDAMDAAISGVPARFPKGVEARRRTKERRVRRNRVVLAPRPWRYVGGSLPLTTGARKAASPGRVRISRKPIARGKPGCLGCTCQNRVHSFSTFSTRRCGRSRRPAFPAPSAVQRDNEMAQPGQIMSRERGRLRSSCLTIESESPAMRPIRGVGKAQRAHLAEHSVNGGHGAKAPLPTLRIFASLAMTRRQLRPQRPFHDLHAIAADMG
jgi:hypothetical protein